MPMHRRGLQETLHLGRQLVQARSQHSVHRLRHRLRGVQPFLCHGCQANSSKKKGLLQPALRALEAAPRGGPRYTALPERRSDSPEHARTGGRPASQPRAPPRRVDSLADRSPGAARALWQPLHQGRQPGLRGGITPVQVLHHQDQGLVLRRVQDQVPQKAKGKGLARLRTQVEPGRPVRQGGREAAVTGLHRPLL